MGLFSEKTPHPTSEIIQKNALDNEGLLMASPAALIEFFVSSEVHKYLANKDFLKTGDKLEGTVIEIKEQGPVLMDFGKFRALANVKFPIRVGEKIPVTVAAKGSQLTLRLENPQLHVSAEARDFVGKISVMPGKTASEIHAKFQNATETSRQGKDGSIPPEIKNALSTVAEHFEPLDTSKDLFKLFSQLKNHLSKSGIFFEKSLESALTKISSTDLTKTGDMAGVSKGENKGENKALARLPEITSIMDTDLKPNLLLLKAFFEKTGTAPETTGSRQMQNLKQVVEELLNNITMKQDAAMEKSAAETFRQEPVQVLNFSLPIKENEQDAKLKVYYNKKGSGDTKKGIRLSLLLSMNRLGEVRTDFHQVEKSLNITFFVKNHGVKEKIDSGISQVKESLERFFNYLVFNVIVSERKIAEFDTEDLEITSERMVDLKV